MAEPDASSLISVTEAIAIIDAARVLPRIVCLPLADALGLRLAEELRAERDYPTFDKSLMDGFAVRCEDVSAIPVELRITGEIAAGARAERPVARGEAMAIMTGAPVPAGADCVVPVEHTQRIGERVRILRDAAPGRFIALAGSDCGVGQLVLRRGTRLEAAAIAVAASVGAHQVDVFAPPRTAVLITGDEIVPIDQPAGQTQIRNSNGVMLLALLRRLGCEAQDLGIVRDDPGLIRSTIAGALDGPIDALFVTGGMSMGEYDYVPRILAELGVELRITKLRIKPGKPFVFGMKEGSGFRVQGSEQTGARDDAVPSSVLKAEPRTLNPQFVFGLPGNPVSGFACTLRLCSRLLSRLAGGSAADAETWINATLESPLDANGPREFYQPAIILEGRARPLPWKGSADIYTLAAANALLVRAENEPAQSAGASVRLLLIPGSGSSLSAQAPA